MTSLAALWLPILLSAVFVFVASSLIHMVLQWHKGDYRKLADEAGVLASLRQHGIAPGQYMFPCAGSMKEFGTPEMQAKLAQGPVGTLLVRGPGSMNMGKALGQWFVLTLVISAIVGYVTGLARAPGSPDVFRVAASVALPAYAFASVDSSIWKGVSWSTTAKFVVDGVIYALVTAAAFAWLWPAMA
jgi:hypothetical protein